MAPPNILPGEEYAAALVRALHDSRLMILLFSRRANQSPQVLREVERAVSNGCARLMLRASQNVLKQGSPPEHQVGIAELVP
jgi:TIR domain-containing protein